MLRLLWQIYYNFEITCKTTFKRFYRNLYQVENEIYKLILAFQIM